MEKTLSAGQSLQLLARLKDEGYLEAYKATLIEDLIQMGVAFEHRPDKGEPFMVLDVIEFINHRVDVANMNRWGTFLAERLRKYKPTVILTVRSSGIPVAASVANALGEIPYVFASKGTSLILNPENSYVAANRSYTEARKIELIVDKRSIKRGDRVVVVDDFLDTGTTTLGMKEICDQAGAKLVGAGYLIEKAATGGREKLKFGGLDLPIYSVVQIENLRPGAMKLAGIKEWLGINNQQR